MKSAMHGNGRDAKLRRKKQEDEHSRRTKAA